MKESYVLWIVPVRSHHTYFKSPLDSVRILTKGGVWIPIFEGCSVVRSKSDALWPIAVLDGAVKQFRYATVLFPLFMA